MPLPPFEPDGDLPEGLHQAYVTEFFSRFGSGTPQRERVAVRLQQAFDLVRSLQIISRIIVWGSFVTAKPAPADADILWVTLPTFDRSQLPVHVDILFDPVLAKRLYGIDVLSIPEGSVYLPTLLDGSLRDQGIHQTWAGGGHIMIQNDTEFQATQYRLSQFEKVVCGLRHELSPRAFAEYVQGYMLEIQRMREEIDEYLLRPLKASSPASDQVI